MPSPPNMTLIPRASATATRATPYPLNSRTPRFTPITQDIATIRWSRLDEGSVSTRCRAISPRPASEQPQGMVRPAPERVRRRRAPSGEGVPDRSGREASHASPEASDRSADELRSETDQPRYPLRARQETLQRPSDALVVGGRREGRVTGLLVPAQAAERHPRRRHVHGRAEGARAVSRLSARRSSRAGPGPYVQRVRAQGVQARAPNAEARAAGLRLRPSASALSQARRYLLLDRDPTSARRLRKTLIHALSRPHAAP